MDELKTRITVDSQDAIAAFKQGQAAARDYSATITTELTPSINGFADAAKIAKASAGDLFSTLSKQWATEGARLREELRAPQADLFQGIAAQAKADLETTRQLFADMARLRRQDISSIAIGSAGASGGGALPGTLPSQQFLLKGTVLDPDHMRGEAAESKQVIDNFFDDLYRPRPGAKSAALLPRNAVPQMYDLPELFNASPYRDPTLFEPGMRRSPTATLAASQLPRPQRPEFFPLQEQLGPDRATFEAAAASIEKAKTAARGGAGIIGDQMEGMQGRTKRATMAFVELSRGAEDFAVTAQMGGFGMGMRSAINNMSQFAFILSPMAGAITGFAGALAAVLVPALLKTAAASESMSEWLDRIGAGAADITPKLDELANSMYAKQGQRRGLSGEEIALGLAQNAMDSTVARQRGIIQGAAPSMNSRAVDQFFDAVAGNDPNAAIKLAGHARRGIGALGLSEEEAAAVAKAAFEAQGELVIAMEAEAFARQELAKAAGERLKKTSEQYVLDKETARIDEMRNEIAKESIHLMEERNRQVEAEGNRITQFFAALDSQIEGLTEMSSEERKYAAAARKAAEDLEKGLIEGTSSPEREAMLQAMSEEYEAAQGEAEARRIELEGIADQEKALRDRPRSLAGTMVGLEEMGRRIQAAAGKTDSTEEQLKKLRERRDKIADEEKAQRRELADRLKEIADNTGRPPVAVAG